MIQRALPAALTLLLGSAGPAAAQSLGPSAYGPANDAPATARLFDGTHRGVSIARNAAVEPDGQEAVRKRIVSQMQVTDNVELGLGVFSVTRDSMRERRMSRLNPMKDVSGRNQTIVAAGMTLRF